jgi:hypothetical protein
MKIGKPNYLGFILRQLGHLISEDPPLSVPPHERFSFIGIRFD